MFVICRSCGGKIAVSHKPQGGTNMQGINLSGNVKVEGNKVVFGSGGKLAFGPGGKIGFGAAPKSRFTCTDCGKSFDYSVDEIQEEKP
ncbi:MAG: hypothetical protein WCI48_07775 [Bacteroidota bacterium]|jgi:DNA-directed RNA polymerase subunit RPC12/RpoP